MVQSNGSGNDARLSRKRARQACIECRERKVRCDVTKTGIPCTNCRDIDASCSVKARKNARVNNRAATGGFVGRTTVEDAQNAADRQQPSRGSGYGAPGHGTGHEHRNYQVQLPPIHSISAVTSPISPKADSVGHGFNMPTPSMQPNGGANERQRSPQFSNDPGLYAGLDNFLDMEFWSLGGIEDCFNTAETYPAFDNLGDPEAYDGNRPILGAELQSSKFPISYASTPDDHNTAAASPYATSTSLVVDETLADRKALHDHGCLSIPHHSILEALGKLYFEFVHPNLPVIDEGEFWGLFSKQPEIGFRIQNFSLTVLQAMMFAGVSVATQELAQRCGYSTVKRARMAYYRRAKLLIDFEFEPDPFRLSQAALLLTFHSPTANGLRVNSKWLMVAVHYARVAGAENFGRMQAPGQTRRRSALKRLWWGCVIRDRVMPLGVRRPIHILERVTREENETHFLTEEDFSEEIGESIVHTVREQKRIYCLVNAVCRLADALTPVMASLFSFAAPGLTIPRFPNCLSSISQLINSLQRWQRFASRQFPSPVGLGDESNAIILFANMMFIYYDYAVISLCHQYMVTKEANPSELVLHTHEDPTRLIKMTIEDMTERTKELVQLNIVQYAPISLSAYLTFPLLLHALNVRASRQDDSIAAQERRRLDIYTRVMTVQRNIYEGCDYPCDVIDKILLYANEEHNITPPDELTPGPKPNENGQPNPKARRIGGQMKWAELLDRKPRLYLRLASHIDFAFCTSLPPKEEDFPAPLRRQPSSLPHQRSQP